MVKRTTAIEADVIDVAVKPQSVNLEDLAAMAEKNEASGQAEFAKAESKIEGQETDKLAADLVNVLEMAAPHAKKGMWWLDAAQFEAIWGASVRQEIAKPAAEIMRRNGWDLGGLMGKYGPYAALAVALVPSVVATVATYKHATAGQDGGAENAGNDSNATTT